MIGQSWRHSINSMPLHKAKEVASQLKDSFVCSWMTRLPAVSSKPMRVGVSRDGGQSLPLSVTLLETSLPITVASGNGPQLSSRNTINSSRPFSTRAIGKSLATASFVDACSQNLRSADFFDNKHHVVVSISSPLLLVLLWLISFQLGGSFATLPRLAQRRSLRNFYQHNYPYAWIGARVAYDA